MPLPAAVTRLPWVFSTVKWLSHTLAFVSRQLLLAVVRRGSWRVFSQGEAPDPTFVDKAAVIRGTVLRSFVALRNSIWVSISLLYQGSGRLVCMRVRTFRRGVAMGFVDRGSRMGN